MNRIVLIGNGFDLAHGLKTQYKDFIDWYWKQRIINFYNEYSNTSKDPLCTFIVKYPGANWNGFFTQYLGFDKEQSIKKMWKIINDDKNLYEIKKSIFFDNINKSIETKGWVDIENEYYKLLIEYTIKNPDEEKLQDLNKQLHCLQENLIEYLKEVDSQDVDSTNQIYKEIYEIIKIDDISIKHKRVLKEYIEDCIIKENIGKFNEKKNYYEHIAYAYCRHINSDIENYKKWETEKDYPNLFLLPDNVMLLSFNYTGTAEMYNRSDVCSLNYIHGKLDNPEGVIFGYGDELDEKNYKELKEHNNNECLRNVKSIKYLESDNYRKVLDFIESEPFQVYIMGHSCGNSDRTLLNTLFEHENCISIKPYYYQKDDGTDNYTELIQNISRNFTDMKLMRDRVVNKTYCKPLPQNK